MPRPIAGFTLGDSPVVLDGLLDTGAVSTVVDVRLASAAGISLTGSEDVLPLAGGVIVIRQNGVSLRIGDAQLVGEVCCAEDWSQDFQLLGYNTVLQHLRVTFDGPQQLTEL